MVLVWLYGRGFYDIVSKVKELGYVGFKHIDYHRSKKYKFDSLKLVTSNKDTKKMFIEWVDDDFLYISIEIIDGSNIEDDSSSIDLYSKSDLKYKQSNDVDEEYAEFTSVVDKKSLIKIKSKLKQW